MNLTLVTLPWPPSVNHAYARGPGGVRLTDAARGYKETAARLALASGLRPHRGAVRVRLDLYPPTVRHDLDNVLKLVLDSMNGILWADDRQVRGLVLEGHDPDRGEPRVLMAVASDGVGDVGEEAFRRAVEGLLRK